MQEVMDELSDDRPGEVFPEYLSQATDVAKSVESHQPAFLFKPIPKAARQIVRITQEFLDRQRNHEFR